MDSFDVWIPEEDVVEGIRRIVSTLKEGGVTHGEQQEAQQVIEDLNKWSNLTLDLAALGCLAVYTKDNFFDRDFQQFLSEQDQSKVEEYGLYLRPLCFCFNHPSIAEIRGIEVYRGGNVTEQVIISYRSAQENGTTLRWMSFT